MLTFCSHEVLPYMNIKNSIILNLSSLLEGFERINILPLNNFSYVDNYEFDVMYYNYILSNDDVFLEFMKIIMALYSNTNVIILVNNKENIFIDITESLQKLIQQRYGYISNIIYDVDDVQTLITSSFSLNGLYNLDIDKERFSKLFIQRNYKQVMNELNNA